MNEVEELVQAFVNIWNECDPARRRESLRRLWSEDGRHLMGTQDVRGYEALEQRVAASNQKNVVEQGYRFRSATMIQLLPGVAKFRWDMVKQYTEEVISAGVGFLALDQQGRITCDYLFAES